MALLCNLFVTAVILLLLEHINADSPIFIPIPKPGTCPKAWFTANDCKLIKFAGCDTDKSCAGNLKCCYNGCGFSCVDPTPVEPRKPCSIKPGRCPLPRLTLEMCPAVLIAPCKDDLNCRDDLKCCQTGCGLTCVPPAAKPGTCPPAPKRPCTLPLEKDTCNHDFGCKGTAKCCFNACSMSCMEPLPPVKKVGECPATFAKEFYPGCEKRECEADADCEDILKCCGNSCGGSQCKQPEKPGSCPQSFARVSDVVDPNARCKSDFDCPGDSKCCSDIIGRPICSPATNFPVLTK